MTENAPNSPSFSYKVSVSTISSFTEMRRKLKRTKIKGELGNVTHETSQRQQRDVLSLPNWVVTLLCLSLGHIWVTAFLAEIRA